MDFDRDTARRRIMKTHQQIEQRWHQARRRGITNYARQHA